MLAYLSRMKDALSSLGMKAVAERYHADVGLAVKFNPLEAIAWRFSSLAVQSMISKVATLGQFVPRSARLRSDATRCDVGELTQWFLTFADGVEDRWSELWDLADRHFGRNESLTTGSQAVVHQ